MERMIAEAVNESKGLVRQNMESISFGQQVETDEELLHKSDASSLSKHNEQYTALLESYVEDFRENSKRKRNHKEDMCNIAKRLLIGVPTGTFLFMILTLILMACNKINVWEALSGLVTALASLVSTFMVIPQMITKYLFNKKEEDHLAGIISKIQEYDRNIRGEL